MGNWFTYSKNSNSDSNQRSIETKLDEIPNHILVQIVGWLSENDVATFRSVCKRWNWIVAVTPDHRLRKLHVARLGVDCKFDGDDVVWARQRNCTTIGYIRGSTREATLRKLRRLTCDEFRLCGHHQPTALINNNNNNNNNDPQQSSSPVGSRRNSFGDGDSASFNIVAVNPTVFTTILASSWRTLSRIFVFRCSLFRFTDDDIAVLADLENLHTLSICRVSDAKAVNDQSLRSVVARGTLEKLVLDRMNVTDRLLESVAENCKKLSFLSVLGCAGVSERGVDSVVANVGFASNDGFKVICRQTQFDYMQFLRDSPRFRLSTSGRALELPQKKISIHFV